MATAQIAHHARVDPGTASLLGGLIERGLDGLAVGLQCVEPTSAIDGGRSVDTNAVGFEDGEPGPVTRTGR